VHPTMSRVRELILDYVRLLESRDDPSARMREAATLQREIRDGMRAFAAREVFLAAKLAASEKKWLKLLSSADAWLDAYGSAERLDDDQRRRIDRRFGPAMCIEEDLHALRSLVEAQRAMGTERFWRRNYKEVLERRLFQAARVAIALQWFRETRDPPFAVKTFVVYPERWACEVPIRIPLADSCIFQELRKVASHPRASHTRSGCEISHKCNAFLNLSFLSECLGHW